MPRPRRKYAKHKIPSYRRQVRADGTDLALVEIDGRRHYLGPYGTPESREKYHRLIAEWEASGRAAPPAPKFDDITVAEVASQFLKWAGSYYVKHGRQTSEPSNIALALRPLKKLCSQMSASEFGPKALKAVRQEMVNMGWSRKYINRHVDRIKRMFKWAVAEEILPPYTYEGLRAVGGLRFGRSAAPERAPVQPVPEELIEPVKRHVSRQVAAMIDMQLLTGGRPGEIVIMRPCDIDRSGPVWVYRPSEHKTEHHGRDRLIYIGPKAQKVLAPFLLRPAEAYCFSPAEAERERRARLTTERMTPQSCGNTPGSNRRDRPGRKPGDRYTRDSYRRAIDRAVEQAFPPQEELRRQQRMDGRLESVKDWQARLTAKEKAEVKAWYRQHHWHPHQLRHNYGTFVRQKDNLESAQILLGHSKADVTQIYAERDMERAKRVALKIG